jgi:5-hydroxyisourate hydrolase-like protein (transthyretin family)
MKRLPLAAFLCLVVLLFASPAWAAEEGVLRGQVVNKTPGGAGVEGLTVTLNTYVNEQKQTTLEATTDEQGRFEFSGLATGSSYKYQVTLSYQEADYFSPFIQFDQGDSVRALEFPVYNATESPQAIRISLNHIIVSLSEEGLLVTDYSVFTNTGDKTYIGPELEAGKRETLRFSLPQGAGETRLDLGLMECCILPAPGGFIDTMDVKPGDKEVAFTYPVKYSSSSYALTKRVDYPTESFHFLIEERGIEVSSPQLVREEPLTLRGSQYLHFSAQNIGPGTTLSVTLSGLPHPTSLASLKWAALGLMAVALGFTLSYTRGRKGRAATQAPHPSTVAERLLQEIAALDDDFEAGKIPEAEYRRTRAQKKARLIDLNRRLKARGRK